MTRSALITVLCIALALFFQTEAYPMIESVDDFSTLDPWTARKAPGTELALSLAPGLKGSCLCMDYDFGETQAYVLASKSFAATLPENFEFAFFIKRTAPDNSFEFKLIDTDGNTFMKKWYSLASVGLWTPIVIRKEDIAWAWGPSSSAPLNKVVTLEIAITGGKGKGQVCVDELELRALPAEAKKSPATSNGRVPRWLSDEQAYWTLVGVPGDENEALLCEDGTIEPHKRGFSILPVLQVNGKLVTRNEAQVTQALEQECLPIPSVTWKYENVVMHVQIFAHGTPGESVAYAKCAVANEGTKRASGRVRLLVQPYQVYPPWQGGGGFSPITRIAYSNGVVSVNGRNAIFIPGGADDFAVYSENAERGAGAAIRRFDRWRPFRPRHMEDPAGFASGAIDFDFNLKPGAAKDFFLLMPLHDEPLDVSPGDTACIYAGRLAETIGFWSRQVDRVGIRVPDADLVNSFKANIAYNLVTKDGAALQPGSRSYDKAWMRDGSIAANALLEVGLAQEARDFIEWFAGFQYDTGEVPPIIDTKAGDPLWEEKKNGLVEYDSQGEFVWLISQYYRFTGDRAFLEAMLPKAEKALEFTAQLRAKRLTAEYRDGPPEKRVLYGILPESTSHEGYYMKHSYWDDFWALRGFEDARVMAAALGQTNRLGWIDAEYADFKKCVYDSISLLFKLKGIDYIPGCAELGDIDPTSTAAAIVYCDQLDSLPPAQLARTFDRFMDDLRARQQPGAPYRFTPYEMRTVPALLRMGRKDDALNLLRFMLKHRRPPEWNHLAEVAHSDYRFPCYIGDMPHTWVGAEYIHAVRSLFVYEEGNTLVLGAGIDPAWLKSDAPISISGFPTCFGSVSFELRKDGGAVKVRVSGTARPPNGFILKSPLDPARQFTISELPAEITMRD